MADNQQQGGAGGPHRPIGPQDNQWDLPGLFPGPKTWGRPSGCIASYPCQVGVSWRTQSQPVWRPPVFWASLFRRGCISPGCCPVSHRGVQFSLCVSTSVPPGPANEPKSELACRVGACTAPPGEVGRGTQQEFGERGSADSTISWPCSRHIDVNFATLSKRSAVFYPIQDWTKPYPIQNNNNLHKFASHSSQRRHTKSAECMWLRGRRGVEDLGVEDTIMWICLPCQAERPYEIYRSASPALENWYACAANSVESSLNPKSYQFQIFLAASPEILHRSMKNVAFHHSDERWLYYPFALPHLHFS